MHNIGLTFETFTELNFKNENTQDLVEYYQSTKEILEEIIKLSETLIKTNRFWREHAKLYHELSQIVDLIPYTLIMEFFDSLYPKLLKLLRSSPDVVKQGASALISSLIFNLPN